MGVADHNFFEPATGQTSGLTNNYSFHNGYGWNGSSYSNNGSTLTAVNFPQVSLPEHPGKHRLLHIHRNQPGVLSEINAVFSRYDVNIAGQYLQTDASVGYVVIDVETQKVSATRRLKAELDKVAGTIRSRMLY